MADSSDFSRTFKLDVENELRIIVGESSEYVTLELLSGLAEVFGSELQENKEYIFPASSAVAVFTWHGCTLKLTGRTESAYIVTETRMIIPVHLHACLEEKCTMAESPDSKGPVTLIVGPTDVGKSTLCRILLNYAARLGRKPLFIDLDVGQSSISIPGTISVLPVEKPSDINDGFDQNRVSVYHFGYKSPGHNISLYFLLIKKLGHTLRSRMRRSDQRTRSSGVIIDTCGWTRGDGYRAVTLAALAFEIDVLFVLEEERLFSQLQRDMPSCVKVVYVPKLSGITERSRVLRSKTRDDRVWEYFYGSRTRLNPHTFQVPFSEVQIFKVLAASHVSDSTIDVHPGDVSIESVTIRPELKNQVLGLSFADSADEDLMLTNIIGFICITDIDMNHETISILSPQPGPLPKNMLLCGDIILKNRY